MNRIAPNNNLPATHFIEVWNSNNGRTYEGFTIKIVHLNTILKDTKSLGHKTIAIFRIRENKLPTLHKF